MDTLNEGNPLNAGPSAAIDVGRAIDEGRWSTYSKLVLAMVSLAFMVDGLANHILSVNIPAIMMDWRQPRAAFANVGAAGLFGVAIGTICVGILADRLGRKTMLIFSILMFACATSLIAGVSNVHDLVLLRFLDGLGIGGTLPTATTLIAELTPTMRRSRAVNLAMISLPIGNFAAGMLGAFVLPIYGWRVIFLLNGAFALLVCLVFLFSIPESPRFLLKMPRRRLELHRLLNHIGIAVPADVEIYDGRHRVPRGPITELFGPAMLRTTLCISGAFFFCMLATNTCLNWIPTLMHSHGFGLAVTSSSLSAESVGGILGSLVGARLVELFGSKFGLSLLAGGGAIVAAGISFIPLDPHSSVAPAMICFAGLGLCLSGLTGCLYGLAAYAYPPTIKATGVGVNSGIGRFGAISSSYAAVATIGLGGNAFFLVVCGSAVLSLCFILFCKAQIPKDKVFLRAGAHVH